MTSRSHNQNWILPTSRCQKNLCFDLPVSMTLLNNDSAMPIISLGHDSVGGFDNLKRYCSGGNFLGCNFSGLGRDSWKKQFKNLPALSLEDATVRLDSWKLRRNIISKGTLAQVLYGLKVPVSWDTVQFWHRVLFSENCSTHSSADGKTAAVENNLWSAQ